MKIPQQQQLSSILNLYIAHYGIPKTAITVNELQSKNREFLDFAQMYNFWHKTSSPKYPESNSRQNVKHTLWKSVFLKSKVWRRKPILGSTQLQTYCCNVESPAELLYNRCMKARLPDMGAKGRVTKEPAEKTGKVQSDAELQQRGKATSTGKKQRFCSNLERWTLLVTVTLIKKESPHPYSMITDKGWILRKNCRYLLKTPDNQDDASETNRDTSWK